MTVAEHDAWQHGVGGDLRSRAFGEITHRIVTGEFESGKVIPEAVFAAALGMSRVPVREALLMATQMGWVLPQPRAGYLVCPMTLGDVRELYDLRLTLEPMAARLATRQLAQSPPSGLLQPLLEFPTLNDLEPADWVVAHYRFHRRISVLSNHRELDRTLAHITQRTGRYLMTDAVRSRIRSQAVDHGPLIEALSTGDTDAAAQAAQLHVRECRSSVLEALLDSESVASAQITHS